MERKKANDNKLMEKEESSTSVCTKNAEELQEIESVNRVFGNPLLMDKIVKYSIYKSNGKQIDYNKTADLRRMNKNWLQSTSRVLAKSGEVIINISIGYKNDSNKMTVLNKFVSVFSKASRSHYSILPIHLYILPPYVFKENSEHLRNFFEQYSDIICKISVIYYINGESTSLKCTDFKFSILQEINFHFKYQRIPKQKPPTQSQRDQPNPYPIPENIANGLTFLQQILQNSPSLQSVILRNNTKIAVNTSSIKLPTTLKHLTFGQNPITENELALFTRNLLPNLKTLDFQIYRQTDMNLTYKILEHFQQQLTNLSMNLNTINDEDESRICIKFPMMNKLKCLKLSGEEYALSPELRHVCPKQVPNLTCLVLKDLSETLFLEWVQGSIFENVKKFKFSLRLPNGDDDDVYPDTVSPNVQIVKEIITSFPNIEKLTLEFMLSDISSLKYLFQNLPQLKKLNLDFKRENSKRLPGSDLVSTFLGIPLELATALVDKTAENVEVAVDNPESIMNLTELHSVTLKTPKYYFPGGRDHHYSEIISKYGLDKMPKLQKIKLFGGFEVDNNDDDD